MANTFKYTGRSAAEIAARIEAGVEAGELTPGDRLPAVRVLATDLGISPGTAASAYRILRDLGVITTDGRRGTTIRDVDGDPRPAGGLTGLLPIPVDTRDLASGGPDPRLLPNPDDFLPGLRTGVVPYGIALETEASRQLAAIARQRLIDDGVPAETVVTTSGALDGVERVLATYLRAGDQVALEDPGWANLLDLVVAMGLTPIPYEVDDEGPMPDSFAAALRRGARAVIVTSRAQNPTGAAISPTRAAELGALLADHPRTVLIEDDHAAEIAGVPLAPLAGRTDRWAFVRSVSKPYGPDLRCAVLAGDGETVSRVEHRYGLGARWVSTILQALIVRMWSDDAVADLVRTAAAKYDERRSLLISALADRDVIARGRTGLNVWIPVADEDAVTRRLLAAGWAVAPGRLFRINSAPAVRVSISSLARSEIAPLADLIAVAVDPPVRSRRSRLV